MSNPTNQDQENTKQSSTRAANSPPGSERMTIRRPRPGTIVIIAPHDTGMMHVQTDECLKIVLHVGTGE